MINKKIDYNQIGLSPSKSPSKKTHKMAAQNSDLQSIAEEPNQEVAFENPNRVRTKKAARDFVYDNLETQLLVELIKTHVSKIQKVKAFVHMCVVRNLYLRKKSAIPVLQKLVRGGLVRRRQRKERLEKLDIDRLNKLRIHVR